MHEGGRVGPVFALESTSRYDVRTRTTASLIIHHLVELWILDSAATHACLLLHYTLDVKFSRKFFYSLLVLLQVFSKAVSYSCLSFASVPLAVIQVASSLLY